MVAEEKNSRMTLGNFPDLSFTDAFSDIALLFFATSVSLLATTVLNLRMW